MYKQKIEKTHYHDITTGEWKEWELPSPEYVPDYSGLVEGTKALSAFVLVALLICRGMGVL